MKQNKAILSILLLILLSSCHTAKNALNKVKKADLYHPEIVAEWTRNKYPCKVADSIVKIDTSYDFVEIQCPEINGPVNDTIYLTKYVKSVIDKSKPYKVVEIKTVTKEIVRDVIDSACYKEVDVYIQDNKKLGEKISTKNDWIIWLLILLFVSLLVNFLQSRK
jgi:hypothetical protein